MKLRILLLAAITLLITCTSHKEASLVEGIPVCGTVQFSDGCSPELDKAISMGIALLHHMTYEEADTLFSKVGARDPSCFWSPWGKAMTYIHPLWNDPPSSELLKAGWELSQHALKLAKTEKEIRYGQALAGFYENGLENTERERLQKFETGWQTAYAADPNDIEAKAFYALSLIATSDAGDPDLVKQKKAGVLAAEILTVIKDHPAGYHYVIHAYDYPGLANNALSAANTYASLAPDVPHALHMPSHIFTRRGMWSESIDWNSRSARSAQKESAGGFTSRHYYHAVDYMVYAHLQRGEDRKAKSVVDEMKALVLPPQPHGSTAYTLAASEARICLERHDWKRAAELANLPEENFPWKRYLDFPSVRQFAIGLGAARIGEESTAQSALMKLDSLKPLVKHPYFVKQMDVQRNSIQAWLAFSKGSRKEALELMKKAVVVEESTQKHSVTPGELIPARELYGDMLRELGRNKEALAEYEQNLQRSPGRLNSLFGAARAAETSGDLVKAKDYYEKIKALTVNADATLEHRRKALEFLTSKING
jgi:tetratricopeptide (TPR) repeat protein